MPEFDTLADVIRRIGVPANRILLDPRPGTATVKDVVRHVEGDNKRLIEMVDRTLVEKAGCLRSSYLAMHIAARIWAHDERSNNIGMTLGPDAMFMWSPNNVRLPDATFTRWVRLPGRVVPQEAVADIAPTSPSRRLAKGTRRRRWPAS
jgi:hypothetical protein